MLPLSYYDVIIFDCDGVIFDSNRLKVDAMRRALESIDIFCNDSISKCINYFEKNFGLSRYHHIKHFFDHIIVVESGYKDKYYQLVLNAYSAQCFQLYLDAEFAPCVLKLLRQVSAKCYVASGSLESELVEVFLERDISFFFESIYGSPKKKSDIVADIKTKYPSGNILMIGDALSDFNAANINDIDFLFYSPFSSVYQEMISLAEIHDFPVCSNYSELIKAG